MIQFRCSCGKALEVHPDFVSRKLQCPGCRSIIRIRQPTADKGSPAAAPVEKVAATSRRQRSAAAGSSVRSGDTGRSKQAVDAHDDVIELDESHFAVDKHAPPGDEFGAVSDGVADADYEEFESLDDQD